jgi:hypothetical protein
MYDPEKDPAQVVHYSVYKEERQRAEKWKAYFFMLLFFVVLSKLWPWLNK